MDFSVLLKDLRDVAEKYQGKSTEPQVSTHAYVDMFTKILKKALKVTEQYDDQITVLWVALNQLASIYKDLTAGAARDQLCKFIFGLCAKTVLNIQWAQLDEESKVKTNFSTTVEDVHKILSQLGFLKFQLILDLMESHWTHPVLSKIMSGEEEDTEDCLEYIQKEDPDILKLRIEIMMKENCEEFALNLCNWSLKHPTLQNDLKIKEHQIFILYKQQEYGKMQEVCETIICHDGIKVMSHLAKTPSNQELCIRLAQVFLIQDWVKPERTCCTQELLKLWIHHQYLADKDEERFLDSIWTVAKVCRDTEQIGVLIDGVKKECGDMFIQLYSELCKFAINIDKGNMEREEVQKDPEEYNKRRLAMSKTCVRMAFMLKEYDFRISRICGLTAFALDPTMDNLNLVNKLYWTMKNVSAASQNSKINIATLYEIERLLGQMRPDSLNPEYCWKQLIPVCKKYKLDYENDKSSIPFKNAAKRERTASQSSFENTVTPMPHMLEIVKSDREVTKKIDTGQKRGKKSKNVLPKDIQKAHLAKMLGEKNLSKEEIERVLSNEFPRNIKQELNDAPSLDVKELDKTINDLKKSIYLETQYRERIKNNLSSLQKCKKTKTEPGENKKEHLSRQELFRQQQQMIHKKEPCYQRQQSAPGGSQSHGPILQRQLSMGSPQPPNAHSHHRQQQMSPPFGGSPPPAHSTSPRMSSPIGFPSSLSPSGFRNPNILSGRKSGSYSQINTSQAHTNIPQQLCNKIKAELQQQSRQTKIIKNSAFNVLRPPGNSQQECAKIAQQIAEMHERQRAEKLKTARIQGQIDGAKVALNSRNIPSRSQISDLLSMTFQGSKGQNIVDGQKSPSLHGTDTSQGKSYLKKKLERSASVSSTHNFTSPEIIRQASLPDSSNVRNSTYSSPSQSVVSSSNSSVSNRSQSSGRIPNENHSNSSIVDSNMLVPGEQGWDPSRGIMKQKYYYKPAKSKGSVQKGSTGDTPLAMKPVYSMIVPKELTNPNRKEDLVKTVTDMMKRFPKGINSQQKGSGSSIQSSECSPTVVRVQSQTSAIDHKTVTSGQQFQNKTSPPKLVPTSSVYSIESESSMSDNHSNFQSPLVAVNSKTIGQNFLEEGLLNLNTLAAASMSVLGQDASQQPVISSLQLTQTIQQQPIQKQPQMFGNPVIESQPMFSPMQPVQVSVQQVVQQPEPILATPLYTMPNPVIPEPVLTQQLASIQPQVDIALQQPVVQQIIAVQNQPIAMNHTRSFVNVVSQQPSFQVSPVGHVNFSDTAHSMTSVQTVADGMSPSITGRMPQQIQGGITSTVTDGNPQSLAVPCEIIPSVNSNPGPQSSSQEGSIPSKQFLASPELSPALFQQILSSLKKGGVRSNNKSQPQSLDEKRAISKGQKQLSAMVSKSKIREDEKVSDSAKQLIMHKNEVNGNQSVNEARQKILELRKQFEQTNEPVSIPPELSTVLPNKQVMTSISNAAASQRRGSGILERLMADDKEGKVNRGIQNSHLSSTTHSRKSIVSQIPLVVSQEILPELVDLGAKEFQLDSILALDNDNSVISENTAPKKLVNSIEEATSLRPSTTVSGKDHQFKKVQEKCLVDSTSSSQQIVPVVVNPNVLTESEQNFKEEKHQLLASPSPSQSTYFNANRLGKERENREVKSLSEDAEELKQTVNSQLKLQNLCVNCDLQFPTEQLLIEHNKLSLCERKWMCVYCKMSFKCAEILKSHEKNYCLKAPSTMVRCCICGVYFQTHEQLKAHLNPKTCKPQNMFKDKSLSEEDIVCGICKRKFESMTLIKEHVKIGCLKKDNNTYSKVIKIGDFDFSVVFKCTKCNFTNVNENIVSKHVEKCKENNSSAKLTVIYACNMCEETFCVREDACRHVKRQCTKLKVTNTQRQVQDVYQKIKDANTAKEGTVKNRKIVDQKIKRKITKEKVLGNFKEKQEKHTDKSELSKDISKNDKHPKDDCSEPSMETEQQQKLCIEDLDSKTNVTGMSVEKGTVGDIKVTAAETSKGGIKLYQNLEKLKKEDKEPPKSPNPSNTLLPPSDDKTAELTAEMQKVQRITAENKFLAEFNEIEKRKQAIRMKKQKELEKQQEILMKKEKDKEFELMKQKKLQQKMEEEREKLKKVNEKQVKEKHVLETEKEQYINSIIGNSTLQQKMKESIEKEKKGKKRSEYEKDKKVSIKVINVSGNEKKSAKQEESCNVDRTYFGQNTKIKTENEIVEIESIENHLDDKNIVGNVMNKKRKKNQIADIDVNIMLPQEKRVLREHVEESERKTRHKHVEKLENTKQRHQILKKKQLSPQDIRKLRGLRAKRLIKKKKYFIDEMEPIQREKLKKESDKAEECQNMIQRIKQNHLNRKIRTEIKGQDIEPFHKERSKKDREKGRSQSRSSRIEASMETLLRKKDIFIIDSTEKDNKNLVKEENLVYDWRKVCRFCGLSNRGINILSHYVQTHKLGFRQISYSYYCNFCNKKFPITQTVQVKEHVFNNHREAVLGRVAIGRYDKKVESSSMNNNSFQSVKNKCASQHIGKSSKRRKHLRALELRRKCAEKLRAITLVRKNSIIDISDLEDESQTSCCSNYLTDAESPLKEEHVKTGGKGKNVSDDSEVRDGRRIAPRLARQMVKSTVARSKRINYFEELKKTSDIDDSSDTQVMTRSRSSSVSSSRSSLIASAKKRKSAITIATRGSLKSRKRESGSLLLTRSGRAVKRPEIDYDRLTESSNMGSGEDNSELEDTDIRKRKSTRIRRLSEKGKSLRRSTSETDESSTDEINRRVTRRSFSKSQMDGNISDSLNNDEDIQVIGNKRPRTGQSPGRKCNNDSFELRRVKSKGKGRERVGKAERVITRQISKNEEESDSETESNFTDIEHVVKMLDDRKVRNAAIGSAESDSESTSGDKDILKRKYRLRKKQTNRKYRETESSAEDVSDLKHDDKFGAENVSDLGQSGDSFTGTEKSWLESQQSNKIFSKGERSYEEKPKVVLIGAEEDDDLNVDYGHLKEESGYLNSQALSANSQSQDDNFYKQDENVRHNIYQDDDINPNVRTVLVDPQDEFAGLEASPEKSHDRDKSAESEIISESVSEVDIEMESSKLPASIMDIDEFEFLKSDQTLDVKINESNLNSSSNSSNKAAYDTEFIKYTENEQHEYSSDSEFDISVSTKEELAMTKKGLVETVLSKKNASIEVDIPPLAEDVPVLPPRDFATEKKNSKKDSSTKELIDEKKTTSSLQTNITPLLKSARVVIEDISVVRKALEVDNVEKKLIQECETSSCLVRIGRLSREEIEKHTPSSRNTFKGKRECDIILLDDSDDESFNKKAKEKIKGYNETYQRLSQNNLKAEKSQTGNATVKLEKHQSETLIQDIVLDGSFIDQLLVSESITLDIQTQEQIAEGNDSSSFEGAECLQVIVEDTNTDHNGAVLVVDVKPDIAENQSIDEVSNVFALIAKSQVDTSNDLDKITHQLEPEEEEVWIENAESYAETPNKSYNSRSIVYDNRIMQLEDKETLNIPDYSNLPNLPKEEHIVLSKLSNGVSRSSAEETQKQETEITMTPSGESQYLADGTVGETVELIKRKEEKIDSFTAPDEVKSAEYLVPKFAETVKSNTHTDKNQDISLNEEEINDNTVTSDTEDQDISSTGTYQQTFGYNVISYVEEIGGVEENKLIKDNLQNQKNQLYPHIPNSANQNSPPMTMFPENNLEVNGLNRSPVEEEEKTTELQISQVECDEDVEVMNEANELVIVIKNKSLINSSANADTTFLDVESTDGGNAIKESKKQNLHVESSKEGSLLEETNANESNNENDISDKMLSGDLKEIAETESEFKEGYSSEISKVPLLIQTLQDTETNEHDENIVSSQIQSEVVELTNTTEVLKPVLFSYSENAKSTVDMCGQENSFLQEEQKEKELSASVVDIGMDIDDDKSSLKIIGTTLKKQLEEAKILANNENESVKINKDTPEKGVKEKTENQAIKIEHIHTDKDNESFDQTKQLYDVFEFVDQNDIKAILSEVCAEVSKTIDTPKSNRVETLCISENPHDTSGASDKTVEYVLRKEMFQESPRQLSANIKEDANSLDTLEEKFGKHTNLDSQKSYALERTDNDPNSEDNALLSHYSQDLEVSQDDSQGKEKIIAPEEAEKSDNANVSITSSNSSLLALQTYSDAYDSEEESVKRFEFGVKKFNTINKSEEIGEGNKTDSINRINEVLIIDKQKSRILNSNEVQEIEIGNSDATEQLQNNNNTENNVLLEAERDDHIDDNSSAGILQSIEENNERIALCNQSLAIEVSESSALQIESICKSWQTPDLAIDETVKEKHVEVLIVDKQNIDGRYQHEVQEISKSDATEQLQSLNYSNSNITEANVSLEGGRGDIIDDDCSAGTSQGIEENNANIALHIQNLASEVQEVHESATFQTESKCKSCQTSDLNVDDAVEGEFVEVLTEGQQNTEVVNLHKVQQMEIGKRDATEQLHSFNKSNSIITETKFSLEAERDDNNDDDSSAAISESTDENNENIALHNQSLALEVQENESATLQTESMYKSWQTSDLSVDEAVNEELVEVLVEDKQHIEVENLHEVQQVEIGKNDGTEQLHSLNNSNSTLTETYVSMEAERDDTIHDNCSAGISESTDENNEERALHNWSIALEVHEEHETRTLQAGSVNKSLQSSDVDETVKEELDSSVDFQYILAESDLQANLIKNSLESNLADKEIAGIGKPIGDNEECAVNTECSKIDRHLICETVIGVHSFQEEKLSCANALNESVEKIPQTESKPEPERNICETKIIPNNEERKEHFVTVSEGTETCTENEIENTGSLSQVTVKNEGYFQQLSTLNDDETAKSALDALETNDANANEDEFSDVTCLDELGHHESTAEAIRNKEIESATNKQGSSLDQNEPKALSSSVKEVKDSLSKTGMNCFENGEKENVETSSNTIKDVQVENVHTYLIEEDIIAIVENIVDNVNAKFEQNIIQDTEIRDSVSNLDQFHETSDDDNNVETENKNGKDIIRRQTSVSSSSEISLISFPEYTVEQNEQCEGKNDKIETVDDIKIIEKSDCFLKQKSLHELISTEESQSKSFQQNYADSTIERSHIVIDLPISEECDAQFLERSDDAIHKNVIKEQCIDDTEEPGEWYSHVNDDHQYNNNTNNSDANADLDTCIAKMNVTFETTGEVNKVEVYEDIHKDRSNSLKSAAPEIVDNSEESNLELCKDESIEIFVDEKGQIQETELDETVINQSLAISENHRPGTDKIIKSGNIENEERGADSNVKEKACIKLEEKTDDQNHLNQNDIKEIKQAENAQEVKHIQKENTYIDGLNDIIIGNDTQQDDEHFKAKECQLFNENQKPDVLKNVEEKSYEAFISSGSSSVTLHSEQDQQSSKGSEEISNLNDDVENRYNEEKREVETSVIIEDSNTEDSSNIKEEEASSFGIVGKDISMSKTIIGITTQTTQNAERSNSSSTDEEDPMLDKWVKEILNQEAEEKREVFEVPSPRRKGMIVGTTCVHKKPTYPFVETKTFKEESPRKETYNVNKTGVRKAYEEKNEKSNLERSKGKTQNDIKTVITEDIDSSKDRKQICLEKQSTGSQQNVKVDKERIDSKATIMKKPTKDKGRTGTPSTKDDQKSGQGKHLLRSGSTQTLSALSVVQCKDIRASKLDDNKSRNQRGRQKPGEIKSVDKEVIGNEVIGNSEQIMNQSSQNNKKSVPLDLKNIEKSSKQSNQVEEIQGADETDEEFRRRTEAVRKARRKSLVKPYESDFNFEDNGEYFKEADNKVTPSASFWPSDYENTLENFDTASLYSSSSGSSGNTGGLKDGKLKVIERCARDFGKDELVKARIHQQLPRTSVKTVLACSVPEKTTVSAMAVHIVKSIGASSTKPVTSTVNISRQQCINPVFSTKMKMIDKNMLSNVSLSGRMVKVVKSSPVVTKLVSVTSSNIKKLKSQLNIAKEASVNKRNKKSFSKVENTKKDIGQKFEDKKIASIDDHTDEKPSDNDFEPSEENLSNKTKALRALHRNDRPFKWDNTPSPPKILRSQTNKVDCKTDTESVEPTGKLETRQVKEKLPKLLPVNSASLKNMRDSKKKVSGKSYQKASVKQVKGSEKMSIYAEGRKTRQRDKDTERDIPTSRGTRSRSGSKDKLKVDKQKPDISGKSKKQNVTKSEHNDEHCKTNVNNLKAESKHTVPKNRTAPRKVRHTSGDSVKNKDKDQTKVKVAAEADENKEIKTRKRKSETEKVQEAKTESNDEPAVDVIEMLPEEPATKVCKLDGTAKSPEKNDVSVCGHKLTIPGCDHCEEEPSGSQKSGTETIRPAVRQIIHGGKVFEIQRGSVTETDLQNFKGERRAVSKDLFSTSNEDHAMKRSKRVERRKRAHSPDTVVYRNVKSSVGLTDINKYISQALSDIKRQRCSNSNSKWTVKQKKSHKKGLPYSFKKASSKP